MKIIAKIVRNIFLTVLAIVAIYNSAPTSKEVTFNTDIKVSSN